MSLFLDRVRGWSSGRIASSRFIPASLVMLASLLVPVPAEAATCSQPQVVCADAVSSDCTSSCGDADCWSLEGRCTFDELVPVEPACGCVDPQAGCSVAHGREQSRLYRRALRRLRACAVSRGAPIESCPDEIASRGITRLTRGVQRRGLAVCRRVVNPLAAGMADVLFRCSGEVGDRAASETCRSVVLREGLRHALATARLTTGCLDDLFDADRGADSCPSPQAHDAIERSGRRLARRVEAACGDEDLDTESGGCPATFCSESAGATAFSAAGCLQCCAEGTARELALFAYNEHPLYCGDGVVAGGLGEECDEGLTAQCDLDCTFAECGDGVLNEAAGEECDDGNLVPADGCDAGCQSESPSACPTIEETVFYARTYGECATNADCPVGACESEIGRCRTATRADEGWTGVASRQDLNHGEVRRLRMECGTDESGNCAECSVSGLAPLPGQCRCENDLRVHCDEGFGPDEDDCGGSECICFAGAPRPMSFGNSPRCQVPKYAEEPSGTINLETGERELDLSLRTLSMIGENLVEPCPYCEGDDVVGDGQRDGVCVLGESAGLPCDADALHTTFPASGGGQMSLDCMPDPGKNQSGLGLRWELTETTGTTTLSDEVPCGFPEFSIFEQCHCGICEQDLSRACRNDAECGAAGPCTAAGTLDPRPNQCIDGLCEQNDAGEWRCTQGPVDRTCDFAVRADGRGFVACVANADCEPGVIGIAAGDCALLERRACFPSTIERIGRAEPMEPVLASLHCGPKTSNAGVDTVYGLPGPIARTREGLATFFCDDATERQYVPGVRDCVTEPRCGDGVLDKDESCDDGNTLDGDGCSALCEDESLSCPTVEAMTFFAGVYGACASNDDCSVGTCDIELARCRTATRIDNGWTGIGHGRDLNHGETRLLSLSCPGEEPGTCGPCEVQGALFEEGDCRCANDSRAVCDEPFAADADNCGGAECRCYLGPPIPFSGGNVPSCHVSRYETGPTGTVDPDSGAREIAAELRVQAFQGENLLTPCPVCVGDVSMGDGLRQGVCEFGESVGQVCDATAANTSLPAPGGGAASLDCMPSVGKNISGDGRPWSYRESTGVSSLSLSEELECGAPPLVIEPCHCGVCEFEQGRSCQTSLDCGDSGRCLQFAPGNPLANQCNGQLCEPDEFGDERCTNGPFDTLCDGILRANGDGLLRCASNADCASETIGIDAGACTLFEQRRCFGDTIVREGRADAANPVLGSVTCAVVDGGGVGILNPIGLPGPTAINREGLATFYCRQDLAVEYVPGGVTDCSSE